MAPTKTRCRCKLTPARRRQGEHWRDVSEIERAACPTTPHEVLTRLYLRDFSVLYAVLEREHVPEAVLGRCIEPALDYWIRVDPYARPPRDGNRIAKVLARPELTRRQLRKITGYDNLAPETLYLVATHPLTTPDMLPVLAVNLLTNSGMGLHRAGRRSLDAGFGKRAGAALHFAAHCAPVADVVAALDRLDAMGDGAAEMFGALVGDWKGDDESLCELVANLAEQGAPTPA